MSIYYSVIETSAPKVVLMDAQPYAIIKYTVDDKEEMKAVKELNLHKE